MFMQREDSRSLHRGMYQSHSGKSQTAFGESESSDDGPLLHDHPSRSFQKSCGAVALISVFLLLVTYAGLSAANWVPRPQQVLNTQNLWASNPGKCGGTLTMENLASYQLITASMNMPKDPASRELHGYGNVVNVGMKSRAYFGDQCAEGHFQRSEYSKVNWMNKRLSYSVDLSQVGCGCNAALYLVSMAHSPKVGGCGDYYCDAVSVCDVQCAEIDLMEANKHAFHTTLHDGIHPWDPKVGCGGAGTTQQGKEWLGPRDWSPEEYGPEATCIDTNQPFEVTVDFPMEEGHKKLKSVNVFLTQGKCRLHASTEKVAKAIFGTLTDRLNEGMTMVISYWSDPGMMWLDGAGYDGLHFCKAASEKNGHRQCADEVSLRDFKVTEIPQNYGPFREALEGNQTIEWLD